MMPPQATGSFIKKAWSAWKKGDVADAQRLATSLSETADGRHLLLLCAFVKGDYEAALDHYGAIDQSYPRYAELDEPVVEAYLHLTRYAEAERFARARTMKRDVCDTLADRNKQPLKVTLNSLTEIPFSEHPLSEYFPGFETEIEGKKVVAHIDTGGTFLHMGTDRAEKMGIKLTRRSEGYHGTQRVKTYHGIVRSFRLGDALLKNVPIVALPSLVDQQDFIIFGTSILEQFLSTLDYPNKRLVLSPRNAPDLKSQHLAMLPENHVQVPFHMWGDHYMLARGGVGEHRNLNFFIDSGLVSLHPDGKGGMRQASFWSSMANYKKWGLNPNDVREGVLESPVPLSLGPLEQSDLLFLARDKVPYGLFGGIQIHGLLSHAFLKQYTWTLDFERRRYIFGL